MSSNRAGEKTPQGVDKVARYGWTIQDQPGRLMHVAKEKLLIAAEYQRDLIELKVKEITAAWSWVGCGVIVVAERDGKLWVIDGQHRVHGACRRSDIKTLPCIVFQVESLAKEASGFLVANTGRKAVSALDKQRAKVCAGDEAAQFVHGVLAELGLTLVGSANKGGEITCIALCERMAKKDREVFRSVLGFAVELYAAADLPIHHRVLSGLGHLHARCGAGLADARFAKRLRVVGVERLLVGANRAAQLYGGATGGERVWAIGMLEEINKGARSKFAMGEPT